MSSNAPVPSLERLDFFNGQRLFAEDLQTLDGFNRQMRWLHNRSLHTFGIGSGFVVRAERGDREVNVSPGYAIDNQGREIILLLPRVETVPPVAADGSGNPQFFDLTVHYPRTEDLEELETRAGLCSTHGVVRRREEPVFCWIELKPNLEPKIEKHKAQIASGEKIVMARISVKDCRLETLSLATRRNVRPERLPYLACGHTIKGQTLWSPSPLLTPDGQFIIVETVVSTIPAHFAATPCYTARIAGERVFQEGEEVYLIEGLTFIAGEVTPSRFKLSAIILALLVPETVDIIDKINQEWSVEWLGVEG